MTVKTIPLFIQANYCFPQQIIRNYLITILPASALAFTLYLVWLCNIWAIWWKLHSMMQSKSKAPFRSGSNTRGGKPLCSVGWFRATRENHSQQIYRSVVSFSITITATNWPQLIIFSKVEGKGMNLTILDRHWAEQGSILPALTRYCDVSQF